MPQTIPGPCSTLFLGYQFLNREKGQKCACEHNSEHIKVEETFLFLLVPWHVYLTELFFLFFDLTFFFLPALQMNGQTTEPVLTAMSCNSSNFGLACHLSNETGERKYSIKAVSVEGTAWTASKDTHSLLATSEVQKSQHFGLGSCLVEVPTSPTMDHSSTRPRGKWQSLSASVPRLPKSKWPSEGRQHCSRKRDKMTPPAPKHI